MYQVVKRDGKITDFEISKISKAITKAFEALEKQYHPSVIDMLALRVTAEYEPLIRDEKITVKIIRASDTSVTLQIGNEKPFVRKPRQTWNGDWAISIGDNMPIGERTWIKRPVNS